MEIKELRKMNLNGLREMVEIEKAKIVELRMAIAHKHTGKVRDLRKAKKNLARILTLISEKENNGPKEDNK
ncbi:MAG: 50S ribosomal protein L29 [Candidatus Moranbacteria bacterium]|nr:50S ribosomal protein L29 [Candidatus Moranbacteria bacterium]